jgi:uncharacterized protein YjbI with pentapeptide repeats
MKTIILTTTALALTLGLAAPLKAENPDHVRRLLETRECVRCDLSDARLAGANLRNANLRGANLQGANLRRANLSGANLSDADLTDANLRNANLRNANLFGADLSDANLQGADLNGTNLNSVEGGGRDLEEVKSTRYESDIRRIYRDLTGRDGSYGEVRQYARNLARGRSLSDVRRDITRSRDTRDALNDLYQDMLGRSIDSSGVRTWAGYLERDGRSLNDVRREIARSPEAQAAINQIYREVLGREADPSGMKTWTTVLARGWSLQKVRQEIVRSANAGGR